MANGNDLRLSESNKLSAEDRAAIEAALTAVRNGDTRFIPLIRELAEKNPGLFEGGALPKRTLTGREKSSFAAFGRSVAPTLETGPNPEFQQRLKEEALPALGATIGTLAGSGTPASIGGAALGGAAGRAGNLLLGIQEPAPTATGRLRQLGGEAAEQAIFETVFKGLGTIRRGLRGPSLSQRSLARPEVQLAQKAGVELGLGQTTQSPFIIAFESILQRAIGSQVPFKLQGLRQNQQLIKLFDDLARRISPKQIPRRDLGLATGQVFRSIRKQAGATLGAIEDDILAKSPSGVVNFTRGQTEKIVDLIKQSESIEGAALPPGGAKTVLQAARDTLFPAEKPLNLAEALTEAKNLRQFAQNRSDRIGGLGQRIRGELLDAIASSLDREGLKAEAKALQGARARFREIVKAMDIAFVKSLAKNKRPEAMARILASRDAGLTSAEAIDVLVKGGTIRGEIPPELRRSFVEEVFFQSASGQLGQSLDVVLVGNRLESVLNRRIGRDVVKAVLKPDEVKALDDIAKLANEVNLPSSLTRPLSAESASLLAFGQSAGVVSAAARVSVLGIALATAGLITPARLAKMVTSKSGPELLKLAARTKAGSAEAPKLLTRMFTLSLKRQEE